MTLRLSAAYRAVRRASVAVLALAALLGGWSCGAGSPPPARGRDTTAEARTASPARLVALPRAAIRRCAALAPRRDVPVLCPTRLPNAQWQLRYQTLETGRRAYLADFRARPTKGLAHHVLAGGRVGRFPLRVRRGSWPAALPLARDLGLLGARQGRHGRWVPSRLKVLGVSHVGRSRALVLRAAGFPDGGIHGGHLGVVWNQAGSGYTLTMHFAPEADLAPELQENLLLESAADMSHFRAQG